jgi:hypothetical protein
MMSGLKSGTAYSPKAGTVYGIEYWYCIRYCVRYTALHITSGGACLNITAHTASVVTGINSSSRGDVRSDMGMHATGTVQDSTFTLRSILRRTLYDIFTGTGTAIPRSYWDRGDTPLAKTQSPFM